MKFLSAPVLSLSPLALAISLLPLSISVIADTNEASLLPKVTVSAARIETSDLPVATQIHVISREDIRQSGATLLGEVLRAQAGLSWSDQDGSGARTVTLSMRGLSAANNTLVMVDGRKLNNPTQAAPALNTIALKDVERIEIIQGSAGVLYGDQAVGGVINIITRTAEKNSAHGSLTVGAGSFDQEDYAATTQLGFSNGVYVSASAQKRQADNFRDNNESDYENALLKVGYRTGSYNIYAEGQHIDDALNLSGSLLDADAIIDPRQTYTPNDFSDQITDVWRVGGDASFGEHWTLLAEYSDRNEEGRYFYDNYYGGGSPRPTDYSLRVKTLTPRIVGDMAVKHGQATLTVGYDGVDAAYESNNGWAPANATQQQNSLYGQLVYPLTQKLTTNIGVRWSEVEDNNLLTSEDSRQDVTAGELGINYAVGNGWRLFARAAEGFRFATPDDNNGRASATPFLRPQTNISYEAGTAWQGDYARVSYSVYHMDMDDEILFDPILYINRNLPSSKRNGFIFDSQLTLSDDWSFLLNYHFLDAVVSEGIYKNNRVPFTAEHTGTVTARFTPARDLTISVESLYTGDRFKADDDANTADPVAAFTVFNVSMVKTIGRWSISARVDNLTNETYAGYYSVWGQYPQAERHYKAGVSYQF